MLVRGTHAAELREQQQVVGELEHAADDQRPAEGRVLQAAAPASSGASAVARLRGTLVTLAAAARSSGGTTAIT